MADIHSKGHVKFSSSRYFVINKRINCTVSGRDIELKTDKRTDSSTFLPGQNQLTTDSGDFILKLRKMKAVVSDDIDMKTSKKMLTES